MKTFAFTLAMVAATTQAISLRSSFGYMHASVSPTDDIPDFGAATPAPVDTVAPVDPVAPGAPGAPAITEVDTSGIEALAAATFV